MTIQSGGIQPKKQSKSANKKVKKPKVGNSVLNDAAYDSFTTTDKAAETAAQQNSAKKAGGDSP